LFAKLLIRIFNAFAKASDIEIHDKPVTTQTQQQLKMADKCVVNKQTRAASNIEQ
jgi:hypothetical protein